MDIHDIGPRVMMNTFELHFLHQSVPLSPAQHLPLIMEYAVTKRAGMVRAANVLLMLYRT